MIPVRGTVVAPWQPVVGGALLLLAITIGTVVTSSPAAAPSSEPAAAAASPSAGTALPSSSASPTVAPTTVASGHGGVPAVPRFVEEAGPAGVQHAYAGEFDFFVGGGVAVLDCDDDGRPDLYLAGGSEPAGLYRNAGQPGGALRFEHVPGPETDLTRVTGAYPLDFDADGHADLAVLRFGENVMLRGTGDCRFERANEDWSFDGGNAWSTAFSARWDRPDGWPTLAVGNYLGPAAADDSRDCLANQLFRFGHAGGYGPPTELAPGWCTLSMLFSDWDRSGRRDLRVSNDRHYYSQSSDGREQLWRIPGDGGPPTEYGPDDGWQRLSIWGMGIASHDVTGDGLPDYYLTSQGDNKLQTLADGTARPAYRDIALALGVTAHRPFAGGESLPSTAWHAEFDDVNNDGLVDLYVAKGNVEAQPDHAQSDPSNLFIAQADGSFFEGAPEAGIVDFARARGAALVDLNADGLLDLVQVNRRANVGLWRNVGAGSAAEPARMGGWLEVRLRQAGGNRDAIGAWVEVRAGDRVTLREVTVGGGHAGGQLGAIHFGLGEANSANVRVTWPDGAIGPWLDAPANQSVLVERGASEVQTIP